MTGRKILLCASLSLQKHAQQCFLTVDQNQSNINFQHSLHRHFHFPISGISICYSSWGVGVRLHGASLYLSPNSSILIYSLHTPQASKIQGHPSPSLPFEDSSFYMRIVPEAQLLPDTSISRCVHCRGSQFTFLALITQFAANNKTQLARYQAETAKLPCGFSTSSYSLKLHPISLAIREIILSWWLHFSICEMSVLIHIQTLIIRVPKSWMHLRSV